MMVVDQFLGESIGMAAYRVADVDGLCGEMFAGESQSFAYAKVATGDVAQVSALEGFGFRVVDAAVQLDCPAGDLKADSALRDGYEVRLAQPSDRSGVETVAAESFVYSRFHLDPQFPDTAADEFKRRWAGNFFSGERGDAMIVACHGEEVAGFLQLLDHGDTVIIDLIAVAKSHQRKGLAAAMIGLAGRHFAKATSLLVGTQIANVPSMRAYQKLGFRVCDSSYVLHYHGPIDGAVASASS
jgi:ribosomal protein S18 acetylase RimI-like enzyme